MKKYIEWEALVALADCSKSWDSWDQSAEYFLRNAQAFTTDKVAEIIRCRDCARRSEHEKLGHVCVNKDTNGSVIFYKAINLDGFCSDALPLKPKV